MALRACQNLKSLQHKKQTLMYANFEKIFWEVGDSRKESDCDKRVYLKAERGKLLTQVTVEMSRV